MQDGKKPCIKDYSGMKKGLVIGGSVVGGLGLLLIILGLANFFGGFESGGIPNLFFLFFIGGPMLVVGFGCLSYGLVGPVSRYVASQNAPVAKDVTNYMLDGTREETAKTVEAISQDLQKGKEEGVVCPKCGSKNKKGDKFCDRCGAPLGKTCPKCGAINDGDAEFCAQCGQKIS